MCTCLKWLYCEGRVTVGPEATVRNSEWRRWPSIRSYWYMGANGKINRDCTKLAVLASCPLKRGGLKPSLHCIFFSKTSNATNGANQLCAVSACISVACVWCNLACVWPYTHNDASVTSEWARDLQVPGMLANWRGGGGLLLCKRGKTCVTYFESRCKTDDF